MNKVQTEPLSGSMRKDQIEGLYPLSGLQLGMLFHGLYDEKAGAYLEQFSCDLIDANAEVFTKSWEYILKSHSILRSAFYYDKFKVPVQCVFKDVKLPVEILDFSSMAEKEQSGAIALFGKKEMENGFNFESAPLMRLALIRLSDRRYHMHWTYHHIILDGWSMPILLEEFLNIYERLLAGKKIEPKETDYYEDYIRYVERRDKNQEASYWVNYLKTLELGTLLPFIKKTAERTKGLGKYNSLVLSVSEEKSAQVRNYAQKNRITVNTLMQGVWSLLLQKYSGKDDVVFGIIVSGRPEDLPGVEQRVGMYINTLPLYTHINKSGRVDEWLTGLQAEQVTMRQHQHTPLFRIMELAKIKGELFDNILVFENYPVSKVMAAKEWSLKVENVATREQTNYPLTITVGNNTQININFHYNEDLLETTFAENIRNHFESVLYQITENVATHLADIKILSGEEKIFIEKFNNTAVEYSYDKNIISLFEEQVIKAPGNLAIVYEQQELTYSELNDRSNQLANYLLSKGVKAETLVPICIERSPDMLIGILAILKTGAAYVPVDPEYPTERIKYIVEDTQAKAVLCSRHSREKLVGETEAEIIEINPDVFAKESVDDLHVVINPESLAYVIYTSGSTGKPKGVMIEYKSFLHYLLNNKAKYINDDTTGAGSFVHLSFTFDGSLTGLFMPLIKGKSIVIASRQSLNPFDDINLEKYAPYDFIKITPSHLGLLEEKGNKENWLTGKLVLGGEALHLSHFKQYAAMGLSVEIINEYGPTETTVGCSTYHFNTAEKNEHLEEDIPIGTPMNNVQLYILNEDKDMQPIGVPGELYIGGSGVARGYLNLPALTQEKFIASPFGEDPFSKEGEARMYKSGDLARLLPDGNLEYLGRIDDQVKIRGYRIELGEIESVILQSGLVNETVVMARTNPEGSKYLAAYVGAEDEWNKEAMINYLQKRLPEYMVPAIWVKVEHFQLTSNGKIDKKALPEPGAAEMLSNEYVAPRYKLEEQLADIWKELFRLEQVGVYDNFFELGGHSLLAMRLVSAVRRQLGTEMAIKDLFVNPTISNLALHLQGNGKQSTLPAIKAGERPDKIPLSFSQERLWFIDQLEGSLQYHIPVVLRLTGKLNKIALEQSLREIINRHEVLRTIFVEEKGIARQQVQSIDEWQLKQATAPADKASLSSFITTLIRLPFDLSVDYMLRATLIEEGEQEHVLVVVMHHIASDGWSMPVIVKEVASLYKSYAENKPSELVPLGLQYADYAIWQRNYLKGEVLENKLSYWKQKLAGVSPLELPLDYPRPLVQGMEGATARFTISKEQSSQLQELSRREGTTLFMTLLAGLNVLLYRYSGQEDINVGTPVANRGQQEIEGLVGFFVNTLALRNEVSGRKSFKELLHQVRGSMLEAYEHQEVPFEKVVDAVVKERDLSRTPLFQVMLVLQNLAAETAKVALGELQLSGEPSPSNASKFEITFTLTETASGLQGSVQYNTSLYKAGTIEQMCVHFASLLASIVKDPTREIGKLKMLSAEEEQYLLADLNDTSVTYPRERSIIDMFEEQAAKTPGATAIEHEEEKLSYQELNERANQLAHYLVSKGIQEETLVPVCIERSTEMIVAVLGILKAGGAYVPIDPEYPAERISYMVEDTGAKLIVSSRETNKETLIKAGIEVIEADAEAVSKQSKENLQKTIKPHNLAYVIYTSGSTGKPKGVMIEHQAMLDHCYGLIKSATLNDCKSFALFAPLVFDAGHAIIFSSLLQGASLNVLSKEQITDGEKLANYLQEHPVDCIKIVPSVWLSYAGEDNRVLAEKVMIFGGEAFSGKIPGYLKKANYQGKVYNHYGPTEATIGKTIHEVNLQKTYTGGVPIGKPFSNTKLYIVDANNQLVPTGASGELYIAGEGLARGYLNQPELTKEKFILDPFGVASSFGNLDSLTTPPFNKAYKTGDKARWNAEGEIEYLGRIDEQVKIRGHRIELGEIENVLAQVVGVKAGAITVIEDTQGNRQLAGYVVSGGKTGKETIVQQLRGKLPEYMIPQVWTEMEEMPLTGNGKVNKKALPKPDTSGLGSSVYTAPTNETETRLAEIWQELLGIKRIGIHDNFFERGGDSILTIQVVSRARRLGYELHPKDIFLHQAIHKLANVIKERSTAIFSGEQEKLNGSSGLLPIQSRYLYNQHQDISHFNQSVLLKIDKGATGEILQQAFDVLINQHDALRFRYSYKEEKWHQEYSNSTPKLIIETRDQETFNQDDSWVTDIANKYQQSLDIEKGDVIRIVLMKTSGDDQQNRLLIVAHHLVVDGISWRILLEDLEQLLNDIIAGKHKGLGYKSSSYRQWFEALEKYGQSEKLLSQANYWQNIVTNTQRLVTDKEYEGVVKVKDTDNCSQRLGMDQTQKLLYDLQGAYNTDINDILLSALSLTFCNQDKTDKIIIGLEGHGREEIGDDIDISRTIGWFTSLYPVLMTLNRAKQGPGHVIKSVKEQLRQLPGKGIGYGILKYINKDEALQGRDPWEVQFNYLGQVDNVVRESKWFAGAGESAGSTRSGELVLDEKMAINCIIRGGELVVNWTYSTKHFEENTIKKKLEDYISNLQVLIAHCAEVRKKGTAFTPSDYGLGSEISYEDLDEFLDEKVNGHETRRDEIESIYFLSGLQEGMLFHSLYDGKVSAYKEQFECDLTGVDLGIFRKSWEYIIQKHTILRTAFYYDKFNIPVQCAYKKADLPIEILDYSKMNKDGQGQALAAYKEAERERGLDFNSAPLMRLAMIRLQDDRYKMIWTYHHIISDGWSMAILMEEFLNVYESFSGGKKVDLPEIDSYEDYIRYIERLDKNQERAYWKNYLKNIESGTLLPFIDKTSALTKGAGSYDSVFLNIKGDKAQQIKNFVQGNHLTINTLMQGVWAYLLHAYTGSDDVVYGVIVSGRPDDLPNVERRVGMYINTLPLRTGFTETDTIQDWLLQLQNEQVSSRQYQYSSLAAIKGWAGIPGDIFDNILIFENYPVNKVLGEKEWSLKVEGVSVNEQTNYPLSIIISSADQVNIRFSYNTALLQEEYVQKIRGHFENVLNQFILDNTGTISDIKLLTDSEENEILFTYNGTQVDFPKNKTVIDLFELRVAETPGNIALKFNDEQLTYHQLNQRSNQVAAYLLAKGIKKEEFIPICIDRSFEMIIGILGVLKSGAAYVPIDPEYPEERIYYILKDIEAKFIITNSATHPKLSQFSNIDIIDLDENADEILAGPAINVNANIVPGDLAYVIYTSGSTGKPKGVMIEHGSVVNLSLSQAAALRMKPKMATLQFASFGFDASCYEIFNTFLSGGTLVLPQKEDLLSASLFEKIVTRHNVELAVLPSSFQHVIKDSFGTITTIVSAGEPLNEEVGKHFQSKGVRVINAYGPTENTVCTSLTDDPIKDNHRVVIGTPVSNTQVYILNKAGALQPAGVPGEMCLAGVQVSRGYLNLPELTAQKFIEDPFRILNPFGIKNPFSKEKNARMYRSGDLARWLPGGDIEYLGRLDDQVKIRGYRIELGEIESVLLQSGLVSQVVVLAREYEKGSKRLVGYIISDDKEFSDEKITSWLKAKLPEYMVPSVWLKLENFPVTPSGKIDRKSLPDPSVKELIKNEYVGPRNDLEEKLVKIWQDLLNVQKIGVYDNFFELGGHSLLAMRLLTAIHKELEVEVLVIKDLFQFSTIDELSKYLEIKLDTDPQEQDLEEFELIDL